MKKVIIILLLIIFGYFNIFSQGFDWQYSARLPFSTPTQFWGLNLSGGYLFNTGDFSFLSNNIPCCTFELGTGLGVKAGIKYENWLKNDYTFFISMNYYYSKSEFMTESEPYLYRDFSSVITEYEYNSVISTLDAEIGIKYRIMDTHFFTGLAFNISYLLTEKHDFYERLIAPKEFFFSEIHYANAKYSEFNRLYFYPNVLLGYDLDMGKGKYSNLYLSVALPVQSVIKEDIWNRWQFSLGLTSFLLGY